MKDIRFFIISIFFLSLIPQEVTGAPGNMLTVDTIPYGSIPLGTSTESFSPGGGFEASVTFAPAFLRFFGLNVGADVLVLPLDTRDGIWVFSGSVGPAFMLPLGERFTLHARGTVGYYYWNPAGWDADENNDGGLSLSGGIGASFRIAAPFTLGIGASYDYYSSLYNGFAFNLAARFEIPLDKPETEHIDAGNIRLFPLFPVMYSYYDNNPVGSMLVRNSGKDILENIEVFFYVERYMDNPMQCGSSFSLTPGEEKEIDLFGIFSDDVMTITEGTKVSSKIVLDYESRGEQVRDEYTPVLEFYNRNALQWDDDRKIASFITAKDPEILGFAKNIMTWMKDVENPALDENLQKGIALFQAVKSYGIQYEIDPATPFSEFSEQQTAIDFLQFPRQTLQYTNGDCDDLSALYTALLEAVGVETAVITVPGHIYTAFALKMPAEEAMRSFSRPEDLVIRDDTAWVPLEITMFSESFEKAWQTGAKQWREHNGKEQAMFYPTRESWQVYPAVGFQEGAAGLQVQDREAVTTAIGESLVRYVKKEIYSRESEIRARIEQGENNVRLLNTLAVLYARNGLYEEALAGFEEIAAQHQYNPALTNMGNIYFIMSEYNKALGYFEEAAGADSRSAAALLGSARCHYELEDYDTVSRKYGELKTLNPDMAERFAYLDLGGDQADRANDALGMANIVAWEEIEE